MIHNSCVIGVDLGGTKVQAARIKNAEIQTQSRLLISSDQSESVILSEVIQSIENVFSAEVEGIGIGVPSIVDINKGIVYNVQNIPSWKEVHLKSILEQRFGVPVSVNNDANCFAIGEHYFGNGKGYNNMAGVIIGTGFAAGIVINGRLYNGHNCGAGEFGMTPYLDKHLEYYCGGQFFRNKYQTSGEHIAKLASENDPLAKDIFREFATHLANGIMTILYAIDPEILIFGGSVSKSFHLFREPFFEQLERFVYPAIIEKLKIFISSNPDLAVLGAAALHFDALKNNLPSSLTK